MTAAVAVNRYLDIAGASTSKWLKSGYVQALLVLFVSTCVNIPRWLEFKFSYITSLRNVTNDDGDMISVNTTIVEASSTGLRQSNNYIRDYTLISATVLIVILPTTIMLLR
jgi:hypothetical protein